MLDWFRTDDAAVGDDPQTAAPREPPAATRREARAPDGDHPRAPQATPAPREHGERGRPGDTTVRPEERAPEEPGTEPEERMPGPGPGPGPHAPGPEQPTAEPRREPGLAEPIAVTRPDRVRTGPGDTEPVSPGTGDPGTASPVETAGPLAEPGPTQARIVCIANQKGGVGKTTTAVSLAAALAEVGAQVLLVDLDPQGNATTGLGLRPQEGAPSTYRVLIEEMPVEDATEPTSVRGLHCLPSSLDLAGAEIELVSVFNRERRLSQGLEAVRDLYDVILIDCPPTLGLLTVNALAAADQVILPIQCEYYALEGVGQLTRTVDLVRRGLNPDLEIGGVVLTMYDGRTKLSEQVADEVRSHFTSRVFRTVIPRTVRLSEAPSYGQPITVYDPSSRGARSYVRLAGEVARRLDLGLETRSPLDDLLGVVDGNGDDGAEDFDHDEERWA